METTKPSPKRVPTEAMITKTAHKLAEMIEQYKQSQKEKGLKLPSKIIGVQRQVKIILKRLKIK